MSNPNDSVEANPHPESSHRKPGQIAADERGPTGPRPAQTQPVQEVNPSERIDAERPMDTERRNAVKRSARKSAAIAQQQGARAGPAAAPPAPKAAPPAAGEHAPDERSE